MNRIVDSKSVLLACFAGMFLISQVLSASPISDKVLSTDLDRIFDTIQAERRDKIEYINNYKELSEKTSTADEKSLQTINLRFYVKTRRGADENFKLTIIYELIKKQWLYKTYKLEDLIQTSAPVVRPAKISVPAKDDVYELVRSRLAKISTEARRYQVYKIKSNKSAIFQWAENYTLTEFKVPINMKMIVTGRVEEDKEYFACEWQTLVRYLPREKKWTLRDLDASSDTREISQSCKKLEQTFIEKMENTFPGEGKR